MGAAPPFLNLCCVGRTTLGAAALLERLQDAEAAAGRPPPGAAGRGGARALDLDLLLYGDLQVEKPELTVPHPRLVERAFVLVPLAEVAGEWPVPGTEATVGELAGRLSHEGLRRTGGLDDRREDG